MPPSTNPPTPRPSGPHPTDPYDADPRPHVAALLTLAALGWHVTSIRAALPAPVLWAVTARRFDAGAWVTVEEADLDDAFEELVHYASADREPDFTIAHDEGAPAAADGPGEPSNPDAAPAEQTLDAPAGDPGES
jgi:hypothetical protein